MGALALAGILSSQISQAQSLINIDFGVGSHSLKTGFAATGESTNDFWNLFRLYDPKYTAGMPLVFGGKLAGVKCADGSPSPVVVEVANAPGVWGNATGDAMYDSYIFASNGSNLVVTVSNLEPGRYNFYLYGHADPDASGEQNCVFKLASDGAHFGPATTIGSAGWKATSPWQQDHQYVVIRNVPVKAGTPVVIEVAPGLNGIAVLNGLQISSKGTSPPRLARAAASANASARTNLVIREIRYEGTVSDTEARLTADLEIELLGTNEIGKDLFQGNLAVVPKSLPDGVRIVRSGDLYRLSASKEGIARVKLEVIPKIERVEPWNEISFTGPPAAIASVRAQSGSAGAELQLTSGTPLENDKDKSKVEGFLAADRVLALRWQGKSAEVARRALVTVDTVSTAQVTPTVIKLTTALHYEILQAGMPRLAIEIPASQSLTKLEGEQIRDWRIETNGASPMLRVEFIKPIEKEYRLTLYSEQPVESAQAAVQIVPPQPLEIERESGTFSLSAEETTVETELASGLRQVNASAGAVATYRFFGRSISLNVRIKRIEPVVNVADRVTARLEETRLLITHALNLNVEKAGIYSLELAPPANLVVTEVKGDGVDDWKVNNGKLGINFASRLLGRRQINVQLEQAFKTFPQTISALPLRATGAAKETAQLGAVAAPGLRLKTGDLQGAREIPITQLSPRADETLAFTADQPDWSLTLATEKLPARVTAEAFNLITVGDGLVGGSATIRYTLINQGVQQFRLQVPAHWRNLEFTGQNIRGREESNHLWTIQLQDKAWSAYTLVVTYDYQFDARQATLDAGGIHAFDVEHETGSVAVTAAASLKVDQRKIAEPLRPIDPTELAEVDRAMISRPVALAYRYSGDHFTLELGVIRHDEEKVLDAVADRTQITSVLNEAGEMLTKASFMVKNNDKQFQKFQLPAGASFWGCSVNNQPSKPEKDGEWLLVPLPRAANRDEAFAVDIFYAQTNQALGARWIPRSVQFQAPSTDVPNTYAEWELLVPASQRLSGFGGTMTVARGTTYDLRDAVSRFVDFYQDFFREYGVAVLCVVLPLFLIVAFIARAGRRGAKGLIEVLVVFLIIGVLASMMLPALSHAKLKAQGTVSMNDLRLIDSARQQYALENGGKQPSSLDDLSPYMGRGAAGELPRDPVSGQPYVLLPQAQSQGSSGVVAYGSEAKGARSVLFADGRIERMNNAQFDQALSATMSEMARTRGQSATQPAPTIINGIRPAGGGRGGAAPWSQQQGFQNNLAAANQVGVAGGGNFLQEGQQLSAQTTAPAALPTSAGLRSIHIDLPRQGQPFTFTKVLNIGKEPLDIKVSMMSAKVFSTLRSIAQVAVFLAGLIVLWWGSHRGQSLRMAIGLALAMGAVGALLLSGRVLHLGLIVAAPVVVMAVLIAIGRKFMPAKSPTDGRGPTPDSGSVPPLVAGLALLVLLTPSLMAQGEAGDQNVTRLAPVAAPTNALSLLSAAYTGQIGDKVAQFTATLHFAAAGSNQTANLFGEDVALQDFSVKSGDAKLLRENGKTVLLLPGLGEATVELKFAVKLAGDVTKRSLSFGLPSALASSLTAQLDEPDADVEFPSAVSFSHTNAGAQTRIEAMVGSSDKVELLWTSRVKRAAEVAATMFVENHTLVTFNGGAISLLAKLDYQITQGELRQLKVALPPGHRLLRVEGESIRTWELKEDSNQTVLYVELLKGVSPSYSLQLETEKALDALPASVAVTAPRALDVKRENGLIAVDNGEEIALAVETDRDLQRVDKSEFRTSSAAAPANLFSAWRFLNPDFGLTVRASAVQPEIEASVVNNVRLGQEQIAVGAYIDYTIKKAGVFRFDLACPAGYRVENVTGPNIAQFRTVDEPNAQRLEVTLSAGALGSYSLHLDLVKLIKELPASVTIEGVHPRGARKLTGSVTVSAEAGVSVKTSNFDGLTEVPAASGPNAASLAYKFLDNAPGPLPGWKLETTTELVPAWVRAEVVNVISLSESLVSGRALVRYEIQNAPVKEFHLRIPSGCANIEVNGASLRRRDHTNEEWRVELQNKVIGEYTLTVTWEQDAQFTNAFVVPGVQALNVERETGEVAIQARSPLQAIEKESSADLMRIDARELPAWAGLSASGGDAAVLAYRYVRPGFKLALNARRFNDAAVLQALVDQIRLTTVVAEDGQMMTEMTLAVRNNGLQHLEVELPAGAEVWSAFVDGQPVRPSKREGRLLLPLQEGLADEDAPVPVVLTYVGSQKFPRGAGRVDLVSPKLDAPLKNAQWDLYLPADYRYDSFAGSMTRQAEVAPSVQSYSLAEYLTQELISKKSRQDFAQIVVSNVRSKLSKGDLSGANKANFYNNGVVGDSSIQTDYANLQSELQSAQSRNLSFGNTDVNVAQRQAKKLQEAQSLAVTQVRPLHINLPTRGLHFAFTQVLQTETHKPMTVQFSADNVRQASWVKEALGAGVGFLLLWLFLALFCKKPNRPASLASAWEEANRGTTAGA